METDFVWGIFFDESWLHFREGQRRKWGPEVGTGSKQRVDASATSQRCEDARDAFRMLGGFFRSPFPPPPLPPGGEREKHSERRSGGILQQGGWKRVSLGYLSIGAEV